MALPEDPAQGHAADSIGGGGSPSSGDTQDRPHPVTVLPEDRATTERLRTESRPVVEDASAWAIDPLPVEQRGVKGSRGAPLTADVEQIWSTDMR